MNTRFLFVLVFVAGVSVGWLGKAWMRPVVSDLVTVANDSPDSSNDDFQIASSSTDAATTQLTDSPDWLTPGQSIVEVQEPLQQIFDSSTDLPAIDIFKRLLVNRFYYDAMIVYQEQFQQDNQSAAELKMVLLEHLNKLSGARSNNDFMELIDNYLSVYYDDIDVLLLLADFNQKNGRYFEVVDGYLLARTYAYTDVDRQNVLARFNDFVKGIDGVFTSQKNWLSLIGLYSHIETSGLMTSTFQYRQAIAHLRSGDEYLATEQLRQLVSDSLVGEAASIELNRLVGNTSADTTASVDSFTWEGSETIALQQLGNQYLVDLTLNRLDNIKLLIDTGASITTLSRESFQSLNSFADAVEQERRLFRTAGGVAQGTVYSVPELTLGTYQLTDTQIAVLDFELKPGVDGLLGMNILGQFRFQIDQENASLLLSRE